MDNAELAHAPTYRLAELIAAKEVSPVEATQLYLDRIEAMDSQLNSYLTVTAEEALEAARSAEEQVARGGDLGPLHGVPHRHQGPADDKGYPHDGRLAGLQG